MSTLRFISHPVKEACGCSSSNSFWLEDGSEEINKEIKFPEVPKLRGARTSPEYRALHNIARKVRPLFKAELVGGINLFKKNINLHDLVEALEEADPAKAMDAVPWEDFGGAIEGIGQVTFDGLSESAEKSKTLFRKSIKKLVGVESEVVFDADNPDVKDYIDNNLGELITKIKQNTQTAIQAVISDGLNRGVPPRESAKQIKQMIGLNDRQVVASMNHRKKLEKQDIKGRKLDLAMEKFTQKQLKYRSELIARTEAMNANNRGMMEVINQNADAGLFDRSSARKKWIVTPYDRVCKICRPMANKEVGIDEEFKLRDGRSVMTPPAHPNCNCSFSLELSTESF